MLKSLTTKNLFILFLLINLTSCTASHNADQPANRVNIERSSQLLPQVLATNDTTAIWYKLQHTSLSRLTLFQQTRLSANDQGWLDLAIISKRFSQNTKALCQHLREWRTTHPNHPGNVLFPETKQLVALIAMPSPKRIAVLLPQRGQYAHHSKMIRTGLLAAYYKNLTNFSDQDIKFYDVDPNSPIHAYQRAVAEEADFIIGPLTKIQVQQIKTMRLAHPTLALNYTTDPKQTKNLYQFGLLPEDEAIEMVDRARQKGLKHALIIAADAAWSRRMVMASIKQWQQQSGEITEQLFYSPTTNLNEAIARLLNIDTNIDQDLMQAVNDKNVLTEQRRKDFDVVFLFATPKEARIIVPLLRYYYAGHIPVYAAAVAFADDRNITQDSDLDGVTICDVPRRLHLDIDAKKPAEKNNRFYALGEDAYHLTHLLQRLVILQNFPIYSATGALSLDHNQQIHRRLPCVTIKNELLS